MKRFRGASFLNYGIAGSIVVVAAAAGRDLFPNAPFSVLSCLYFLAIALIGYLAGLLPSLVAIGVFIAISNEAIAAWHGTATGQSIAAGAPFGLEALVLALIMSQARSVTGKQRASEAKLRAVNEELERRVLERTAELSTAILTLTEEVVERTKAREALRQSEERFRSVVEGANEIIFTLSPEGIITSINTAFERILGWWRQEWYGSSIEKLLSASDPSDGLPFDLRAIDSPVTFKRKFASPKRQAVMLEVTLIPEKSEGDPCRILGFARDVTDEELAQEKIRRSEQQLAEAQRIARLGSWEWDLPTNQIRWSDEHCRILGVQPREAMSFERFVSFTIPGDRMRISQSLRQVLQNGFDEITYRIVRVSGEEAVIRARVRAVFDCSGSAVKLLGTVQDITDEAHAEQERVQLEKQLERAERISGLGRVASSVAHEFNNVLMGIQPFVDSLERMSSNPRIAEATASIRRAVLRGKRITEEIRRFARPSEASSQTIHFSNWLRELETEIMAICCDQIDVRIDLPADPLYVAGDSAQYQQVIMNIVLNAKDAMPDGGSLTITARLGMSHQNKFSFGLVQTPDRFVHVTIEDTGVGMPPEVLHRVFEPFYTTKKGSGTGLGLAVAHHIVTSHGGHVFVESEPGKGTKFHLFLPAELPPLETHSPSLRASSGAKRRVLIVEDDEQVAKGLKLMLELEGHEVDVVHYGGEAEAAVERFAPDVALVDVSLPDIDGFEVYARLADRWPDLPVVFSSGHASEATVGRRPGARVEFLPKPYDSSTLLATLDSVTA